MKLSGVCFNFNSKATLFLMFCFIPEHIYFCFRRGAKNLIKKKFVWGNEKKKFPFWNQVRAKGGFLWEKKRMAKDSKCGTKIDKVEAAWKWRKGKRNFRIYKRVCIIQFACCWMVESTLLHLFLVETTNWVKGKWVKKFFQKKPRFQLRQKRS